MKNYKFKICNLDCTNCANELESALSEIDIISNVSISFMTEKLSFDFESENIDQAIKLVKKIIKREEPDVTIEEL
ncbi:MAG: heavy-metal-associated domain-containing protein [Bacilli bacterium]